MVNDRAKQSREAIKRYRTLSCPLNALRIAPVTPAMNKIKGYQQTIDEYIHDGLRFIIFRIR